VKWSDGVPLTAKDVAYTVNRIRKSAYEQTNYGSYVAGVSSVAAPDDRTVVIRTSRPSPVLLRLPIPILPAHIWSKISSDQVPSYKNEVGAVGSGPFVLAERKPGQYLRLTANKDYWRGAPKIDELVYRVYGSAAALAQAMRQGAVDFADNLDTQAWESVQGTAGIRTHAGSYSGFDELAFNTGAALTNGTPIGDGNPALKNKQVRQALNQAIDRNKIIEQVLHGNGISGNSVIPSSYALHYQPPSTYRFNLTKAGRLLDAAGYRLGANRKRTAPGGAPLSLRLFTRKESATSQQTGKLIKRWFGALGIPVTLQVLTEDALTERIGQGTFDMFEWGWRVEPDPDFQLSSFTCAERSFRDGRVFGNRSDSFYCNPVYDQLYAKQARQIVPAQRAATIREMQRLLYGDAPYAVLYEYDDLQAYSAKFTGYVTQGSTKGPLLFQYGAWSYLKVEPAPTGKSPAPAAAPVRDGGDPPVRTIGVLAVIGAIAGLVAALRKRRRRTYIEDDAPLPSARHR
jgi:peptide/nickel transport system substrate-binding protein